MTEAGDVTEVIPLRAAETPNSIKLHLTETYYAYISK
jgi:hypothetical protein